VPNTNGQNANFENKLFLCGKACIKEKIEGIEGSSYGKHFIIQTCRGKMQIFNNKGISTSTLAEPKNCLHNYNNFKLEL